MNCILRRVLTIVLCMWVVAASAQDDGKHKSKKPKQEHSAASKDDLAPIGDSGKEKKTKAPKEKKHTDGANKPEKPQGEEKKHHDEKGGHKGKGGDDKKPHAESDENDAPKGGEKAHHGKPERDHHEAADSSKHRSTDKPGTSKKPETKKEEPAKPRPANVEVKVDDPIDRTRKGPSGQNIYTAPRGGKYYINASGNKVFITNNTK